MSAFQSYSPLQIKAVVLVPILTGSVSFISSATLASMIIMKSEVKLSIPSKRIVFGLCICDCFMSAARAASVFPVPVGQGLWGASGTEATCTAQGFLYHIGTVGSIWYSCALSLYYMCAIKFSMNDNEFKRKFETICHAIPNLYGIAGAIFLLCGDHFNSINNMCYISAVPQECIFNPDVECVRGSDRVYFYFWVFLGGSLLFVFFMVSMNMFMIIHAVWSQHRKSDRWRSFAGSRTNTANDGRNTVLASMKTKLSSLSLLGKLSITASSSKCAHINEAPEEEKEEEGNINSHNTTDRSLFSRSATAKDPLAFDVRKVRSKIQKEGSFLPLEVRVVSKSKSRLSTTDVNTMSGHADEDDVTQTEGRQESGETDDKATFKQGMLYIFSFLITYLFPIISRGILSSRQKNSGIPFIILLLNAVFSPLQGLFNILVYCRPNTLALRKRRPEYTVFKAYWLTIRSGGDDDNAGRSSRAYSSTGARRPSLKVIRKLEQQEILRKCLVKANKESRVVRSGLDGNDNSNNDSDNNSDNNSDIDALFPCKL